MKNIIYVCLLFLLTGCTGNYRGPANLAPSAFTNYDKKVDDTEDRIVEAFDKRDKELLKSVLNKDVLKNPNLDNDIQKAFDFYKGTSVSYSSAGDHIGHTIENKDVRYTSYPSVDIVTNCDRFRIEFAYNVRDEKFPQNEGVYGIRILPGTIFKEYFSDSQGDEIYQLDEKFPIDTADRDKDYKQFGLCVFTYYEQTIRKAYFDKNGEEMILYEVDKDGNLVKDENGNKIIKEPETETSSEE